MNVSNLPSNHITKKIVRQEEAYEAAGLDGEREIPLPFVADLPLEDQIAALGFDRTGCIRALNQTFVENIGNLYAARVRNAVAKKESLPDQSMFNDMIAAYDFSGVRASSEAGMSAEDRAFRTELRKQLRAVLREGGFSADGSSLTVQPKSKAAEAPEDGQMSVEDFDTLVEAAAEGAKFEYEGMSYDFGEEPQFDEDDGFASYSAISAWAKELADEALALRKRGQARRMSV